MSQKTRVTICYSPHNMIEGGVMPNVKHVPDLEKNLILFYFKDPDSSQNVLRQCWLQRVTVKW